jgi:hypothetical protein
MHAVRHALALTILCGTAQAGPRQCIARHFALRVDGDKVVLADGRSFPFDDGKTKTFDETLDHPDVEDMFALPYKTGPIVPIERENDDPGRVRIDALFEATWPRKALQKGTFFGQAVRLQPKVIAALERVEKRVAGDKTLQPFFAKLGGTFNDRNIAGTDRRSAHAHGIAIDIDTSKSHYWRWSPGKWKNLIPQKIVDAFEAEGFIWGGRWYHFDTMHFEFRPELLDPECRPSS